MEDEVLEQTVAPEPQEERGPGVVMAQYCLRSGRRLDDVPERWVPESELGPALAQGWREVGVKNNA